MASLDSLPPDQRAVLTLVLQRGHSFDDIAELLSIDRAAVRERALGAMDALGPETELDSARRALITDYLLGQLPPRVAENVREELAGSPPQRAWARVLGSDLASLSTHPLPEIPSGTGRADSRSVQAPDGAATAESAASAASRRSPEPSAAEGTRQAVHPLGSEPSGGRPPSSRRGGAILLGAVALIVVAVVIVVVATSGGSSSHSSSTQAAVSNTASATTTAGSQSTTSGASAAKPIAQVNLTSPSGNSKVGGVAIVVKQGTSEGLVIRAQGVPPNSGHDAYAVWLSNGVGDEHILGFVNPGVAANGVLQTAGALPTDAAHFKQLLVTRESQAKPTAHGPIVLQGALSLTG